MLLADVRCPPLVERMAGLAVQRCHFRRAGQPHPRRRCASLDSVTQGSYSTQLLTSSARSESPPHDAARRCSRRHLQARPERRRRLRSLAAARSRRHALPTEHRPTRHRGQRRGQRRPAERSAGLDLAPGARARVSPSAGDPPALPARPNRLRREARRLASEKSRTKVHSRVLQCGYGCATVEPELPKQR